MKKQLSKTARITLCLASDDELDASGRLAQELVLDEVDLARGAASLVSEAYHLNCGADSLMLLHAIRSELQRRGCFDLA